MGNITDFPYHVESKNPMSVEDIAKALATNSPDVDKPSPNYSNGTSGADVEGRIRRYISYSASCWAKDPSGKKLFKVSAVREYEGHAPIDEQEVEEFKEQGYLFQTFKVTPLDMDYVVMEIAVDRVNMKLGWNLS